MTKQRSVTHGSFTIERVYANATPARVFDAFANPASKARWFHGPDEWDQQPPEMDFRVGGREVLGGGPKGGVQHRFESRYYDIVQDQRIIYAYDMHLDDARISVSLATIELFPDGKGGTRLVMHEDGAFLDGYDDSGSRERGTRGLLDQLGAWLG
jgi:uncharacterized protein YndB with AHSA1/START domain